MVDNQNGHRYCKKNMKTSGQKKWSEKVVRKGVQVTETPMIFGIRLEENIKICGVIGWEHDFWYSVRDAIIWSNNRTTWC